MNRFVYSIATVIGKTPHGTGVLTLVTFDTSSNYTSRHDSLIRNILSIL